MNKEEKILKAIHEDDPEAAKLIELAGDWKSVYKDIVSQLPQPYDVDWHLEAIFKSVAISIAKSRMASALNTALIRKLEMVISEMCSVEESILKHLRR